MFADIASARKALTDYFYDESVETLLAHLRPAIAFDPLGQQAEPAPGATRIGGMPDLPASEPWPIRTAASDAAAIAARGGTAHGEHIRRYLAQPFPFQFLAQIDLAEAKALGDVARDLPADGRLLFFYDNSVGPWSDGRESCRVIHDRSPPASLARQGLPQALIAAHRRDYYSTTPVDPNAPITEMTRSTFWGPARAMRMRNVLALPAFGTIELQADDAHADKTLAEALQDGDFEASYQAAFEHHRPPTHQLLGLPVPVQDDPRYSAVSVTEFGEPFLTREVWDANRARIYQAASEWRLLLQIELSGYLQESLVEGTVYVLITRAALAAQQFDQAVAIYQQT